jgi:hypothetical protein
MKKGILTILSIFALFLIILPNILAINIQSEKISKQETIVLDLNKPIILELNVTNLGNSETFKFESTPGFFILKDKEVKINNQETKKIQLEIYSRSDFSYTKPYYTLLYIIKGEDNSYKSYEADIKVIDLKNVFEISMDEINPDSEKINLYVKNKENYNFEKIKVEISSQFFNFKKDFQINPKETKNFIVELNKEEIKKLTAGFYTIKADIETQGEKETIEGTIKFAEKTLITSTEKDYGFFIITNIISKTNEGNVIVDSNTTIKKNVISRLFTSFSPEPDAVQREGFDIYYTWNKDVKPGQKLDIIIKTNWLFPFLILFFIIVTVIFAKNYSKTNLLLKKKVSFVNAKGGEFALKVTIIAKAKKYSERISIIDRLPPLVKLHERFMGEQPSRIDEKNKRIEWEIGNLDKGEVRVLSYIIYSKVGVLGKFSLPSARAVFESEGKIQETISNRAFFVSEQRKEDLEED